MGHHPVMGAMPGAVPDASTLCPYDLEARPLTLFHVYVSYYEGYLV